MLVNAHGFIVKGLGLGFVKRAEKKWCFGLEWKKRNAYLAGNGGSDHIWTHGFFEIFGQLMIKIKMIKLKK